VAGRHSFGVDQMSAHVSCAERGDIASNDHSQELACKVLAVQEECCDLLSGCVILVAGNNVCRIALNRELSTVLGKRPVNLGAKRCEVSGRAGA
jgi:hypothetical protein